MSKDQGAEVNIWGNPVDIITGGKLYIVNRTYYTILHNVNIHRLKLLRGIKNSRPVRYKWKRIMKFNKAVATIHKAFNHE